MCVKVKAHAIVIDEAQQVLALRLFRTIRLSREESREGGLWGESSISGAISVPGSFSSVTLFQKSMLFLCFLHLLFPFPPSLLHKNDFTHSP